MKDHPEIFKTNSQEEILFKEQVFEIQKCQIEFNLWKGDSPNETFGNKTFLDFEGKPIFAEMVVLKMLQTKGWNARWINTYGGYKIPRMLEDWIDDKYSKQIHKPIESKFVNDTLHNIKEANNNKFRGCWDIIAWHKEKIQFFEVKNYLKDKIRDTQINWFYAGLKSNLDKSNFKIIEWREKWHT